MLCVLSFTSSALEFLHSTLLSSGLSLVTVPIAAVLASLPISLLSLSFRIRGRLGLLAVLLLLRMFCGSRLPDPGPSRVVQLDVGQGDSALVVDGERGSAGLIDTGSKRALGRWEWIRVLAASGIGRLDYVLLTHPDEDHAGGLGTLRETLAIGCVAGVEEGVPAGTCFPHALAETHMPGPRRRRANAEMLGVYVRLRTKDGAEFAYANLGDADAAAERAFLPWIIEVHDPSIPLVFKASHHGSRTSSDPSLIAALSPREVWFSSGVGNRYGHPARSVMENWRESGVRIRLTAREGGIQANP